jgi:sugar lactone lactonase YvrE
MTTRRTSYLAVSALLLFSLPEAGFAQPSVTVVPAIRTVVTSGSGIFRNVAFDAAGNMYIAGYYVVYKVTTSGAISTFAGGGSTYQDGVAPTATELGCDDVKVDPAGNVYISDSAGQAVRVVNTQASAITLFGVTIQPGTIRTVAGTLGVSGFDGSHLSSPANIFLDGAGNLWIADSSNNAIREVAPSGGIGTIVGQGPALSGRTGDGGNYNFAKLSNPQGVAVDSQGNIYIADTGNSVVRAVNPNFPNTTSIFGVSIASGDIATVAGINSNGSYSCGEGLGNGGPASSAELCQPFGVTLDAAGNLWIADTTGVVRFVNAQSGTISTIAGVGGDPTGETPFSYGDGGPATSAAIGFPFDTALDSAGNLYIAQNGFTGYSIRQVYTGAGFPATQVGTAAVGINVLVQLNQTTNLTGLTVSTVSSGAQDFIAGPVSGCVVSSDGSASNAAGTICTIPVSFQPVYPGVRSQQMVLTDVSGNHYYVGLSGVGLAPQVALIPGTISTVAGGGSTAVPLAPIAATTAAIGNPTDVAIDNAGNLYIPDAGNKQLLKVSAGNLVDFTPNADWQRPAAMLVDHAGLIYVADNVFCVVETINPATLAINLFAGDSVCGASGDGGLASSAGLLDPVALAADGGGNIYIADYSRVRKVTAATGAITTVAGNGNIGFSGDGGLATKATLSAVALALDSNGNIYIADAQNCRVRKVAANTGGITTVAGDGTCADSGDGGAAVSAGLNTPSGVAVDAAGNLYIADENGNVIRKVDAATGLISTIAGTAGTASFSGDNGPSTSATLNAPSRLKADPAGNLYLVDQGNHRVRMISAAAATQTFPSTLDGQTSATQTVKVSNTGNQTLTLSGLAKTPLAFPFLFEQVTVSGANCTSTSTVAPGSACLLGLALVPLATTGVISQTVTFTDNALNNTASTQTLSLQGVGTGSTPVLAISKSHGGNNFALGENNAQYVVTVSNGAIAAPTSGTVTVTENVPTGMTLVSMSGANWNCSSNTCTRSDVLGSGASYPPINVTVNVATSTAGAAQLTNSVTVSGGGSASATANDVTNITQTQTSVLSAATTTGGPGVVVHVPLTLALTAGISMDTLNFGAVITPSAGAPALTAVTSFAANAALSVNTNVASGNPVNQLGVLFQSQTAAFTGTVYIGDILVTVPSTVVAGQSYTVTLQGTGGSLAGVTVPLNSTNGAVTMATYLVGDVYPNTGDTAGLFGQGSINTLSLIATLRAVVNLAGFLPPSCSDLYDAMDSFPVDGSGNPNTLPGRPGGDGLLNTLDLIETLKRAVNLDTSRPYRIPRGLSCTAFASMPAPPAKAAALQRPAEGDLEMAPAGKAGDGWGRTAVYLRGGADLNLAGLSLSLGTDYGRSMLRFVAAAGQSPSIVDNGVVGKLGVAWLEGSSVKAGQRILLGYVEAPPGTPALAFYGASANAAGDGREVRLTLK